MGQKEQCKDELRLIKRRNEPHIESGWIPRGFCDDCNMFRFIHTEDYDEDLEDILAQAFADPKMSVLVECQQCNFSAFDLTAEFQRRLADGVIGAVRFKAKTFKGRWVLCDDPHPYDRRGQLIQEHPNHAQVICVKEFADGEALKLQCEWIIPPA